jgi:hypothetical protein
MTLLVIRSAVDFFSIEIAGTLGFVLRWFYFVHTTCADLKNIFAERSYSAYVKSVLTCARRQCAQNSTLIMLISVGYTNCNTKYEQR